MSERLSEYKEKCIVLKKIQSNKAKFYRRFNNIQNFLTVFVSAFITFIGFSGTKQICENLNLIFHSEFDEKIINMIFNLLVFILFFSVVFHLVFQFGAKQTDSEKAIGLLSSLINEIDNTLDYSNFNYGLNHITLLADKYEMVTQIIPANTDREYKKAKKDLKNTKKQNKNYSMQHILSLSDKEQEKYLIHLLEKHDIVQRILTILSEQNEDLYLGGGVVRNAVWDNLHGYSTPTIICDVDVIYYNTTNLSKENDIEIQNKLKKCIPNLNWSVKNQARMHICNNDEPYISLEDAVSKCPETASAILVRKERDNSYKFIAPFKYDDLFRLIVIPTPHYYEKKLGLYQERINQKKWKEKWNKLKILYTEDSESNREEHKNKEGRNQ